MGQDYFHIPWKTVFHQNKIFLVQRHPFQLLSGGEMEEESTGWARSINGARGRAPPKSLGTEELPVGRRELFLEPTPAPHPTPPHLPPPGGEAALLVVLTALSHFFPFPVYNGQFSGKREYLFSYRCWLKILCILVLSACFQMQMAMDFLDFFFNPK